MDGSSQLSKWGPKTMPTANKPIIEGSLNLWQSKAAAKPSKNMRAKEANIKILP